MKAEKGEEDLANNPMSIYLELFPFVVSALK